MFDIIELVWHFLTDILIWLMQVVVRLLCVLLAIPFVFLLPRGRAYQHLSYPQTVVVRFKFLGR